MAKTTEQVRALLQDQLEPGEVVLAATKAQLDGGSMRLAKRTGILSVGGVVAVAGAVHLRSDGEDLEALLGNGAALAVTTKRVVVMDVTATTAKPKSVVLTIDRAAVAAVTTGEKRVMLVKMTTISLALHGEEANEICFEVPKIARADGEAVVAALRGEAVAGGR